MSVHAEDARDEFRLDELARRAGVASTTVRLYQSRGLLHSPRVQGRTGWYDDTHLIRLRLIARLQQDGHSLAGIHDLLTQWERGRSLDAIIGVEAGLDALVNDIHAIELDPEDLVGRFPAGAMSPAIMQRAGSLGLVTPGANGAVRISDPRFVESGATLAHLGVPLDVILDGWEALSVHTDAIAAQFVDLFDEHLAPTDWRRGLDDSRAGELVAILAQLHTTAREVVSASLDASLTRIGRQRLGQLIEGDTGR